MLLRLVAEFLVTARPTEQKIDFLVRQMQLTREQVELCIDADPSPNQTDYVTWLARWLRKGRIRLPEDSPRLKEMLSTFTVQKRQPTFQGNKDINAYDPAQLSEALEQNAMTVVRGRDLDKLRAMPGVELVVKGRWPELEKKLNTGKGAHAGHAAYNYAVVILKAPWSSVEGVSRANWAGMPMPEYNMCSTDPEHAIDYAEKWGWTEWPFLRDRLKGQDKHRWYIHYLSKVEKRRDPKLEARLLSPEEEVQTVHTRHGPNKHTVDKDDLAAIYATEVIHGRWPELEAKLLKQAEEKDTPLLSEHYGGREPKPQFYNRDNFYYTRMEEGPHHYITRVLKDRWPELEQALLRRYQDYPMQWEKNQELLLSYLKVLEEVGRVISHDQAPQEEPSVQVTWPEGEERFGQRAPAWEEYLFQHGRELTLGAAAERMYNPWEGVYGFAGKIHDYIAFIRSHGGDWREGVKLLNWIEKKRKGQPYGEGLSWRMEEKKAALLRRRRLLPLGEGQ